MFQPKPITNQNLYLMYLKRVYINPLNRFLAYPDMALSSHLFKAVVNEAHINLMVLIFTFFTKINH